MQSTDYCCLQQTAVVCISNIYFAKYILCQELLFQVCAALHSILRCRMMQFAVDCSSLHCKSWVDWSNHFKSALHSTAFGCRLLLSAAVCICYGSRLSFQVCTALDCTSQNLHWSYLFKSALHSIWMQSDCCSLHGKFWAHWCYLYLDKNHVINDWKCYSATHL